MQDNDRTTFSYSFTFDELVDLRDSLAKAAKLETKALQETDHGDLPVEFTAMLEASSDSTVERLNGLIDKLQAHPDLDADDKIATPV